jgi:hypothetical protein
MYEIVQQIFEDEIPASAAMIRSRRASSAKPKARAARKRPIAA